MNKEFLESMVEKLKNRVAFRSDLRINHNYINWLERFTKNNNGFDTSALESRFSGCSDKDKKNISNIEVFYDFICDFAKRNYLIPNSVENGNYYSIKYNGVGFYIGIEYGENENSFYCTRLDEVEDDSIDYESIVNIGKIDSALEKEKKLHELSSIIEGLFDDNVPIELIENETSEAIQKIKSKGQC